MPGMMRWTCSRGCCTQGDRRTERRAWLREVADEMAPDYEREYEFFRDRADAGLPVLGGAGLIL